MAVHHHEDAGPNDGPISMRAYAKLRGCNVSSVSRAIADGKLAGAIVTVDGKPMIRSAAVADATWTRNTRPLPNRAPDATPTTAPTDKANVGRDIEPTPDYFVSRAIREAALARRDEAAAEVAELELAKLRGDLVDANEARAAMVEMITRSKTHLLGVPTKFRQRCPHIAAGDIRDLVALIREALEDLADNKVATPPEGAAE